MTVKPLIKVLTDAGLGSRRRIADAIKQCRVEVNGVIAESFNHPVNLEKDNIYIDNQRVNTRPDNTISLMLNKPANIVSTVSDEKGRTTVLDILPPKYRRFRLYPAGRLDQDSTGLLILTNDGDLTYRLTHPKFEYMKEYLVQVKNRLKREDLQKLRQGIQLEDGMTHPAGVKMISSPAPYNYSITIHEGRKRQIRRMFEHVGYSVQALKRIRIGDLQLGDLGEGEVRRLRPREIAKLMGKR